MSGGILGSISPEQPVTLVCIAIWVTTNQARLETGGASAGRSYEGRRMSHRLTNPRSSTTPSVTSSTRNTARRGPWRTRISTRNLPSCARHELWKKSYPDQPAGFGPAFTGLSNARPETIALSRPPVDMKNLPFNPLQYIEHLDQLPFDPNGEADLGR